MPLYEYLCDACGHRFEIIQKYSDPPVGTCPQCGGTVSKQISSPAIQFRGTGFYVTDYPKHDASRPASGKDKSSPSADSSSTSGSPAPAPAASSTKDS